MKRIFALMLVVMAMVISGCAKTDSTTEPPADTTKETTGPADTEAETTPPVDTPAEDATK
jgi:PBP1b-binding outer membrane lipoprotein LpoB